MKQLLRRRPLLFLSTVCIVVSFAYGQTSRKIEVTEPGSLKEMLGTDYSSITDLTVTGVINQQDVKDIAFMGSIEQVSLSGSSLVAEGDSEEIVFPDYSFSFMPHLRTVSLPSNVERIGRNAFHKSLMLEEVVLPTTLKEIGANAFMRCDSLKTIKIPEGVTAIYKSAFYKCASLKELVLPSSLQLIGEMSFYQSGLEHLSIGMSVDSIGSSALSNCQSLTTISVDVHNEHFAVDNGSCLYSKDHSRLLVFPAGASATSYVAPSGLKQIDPSAFEGAQHLVSVDLGQQVSRLETTLFAQCPNLEVIRLGRAVQHIGLGIIEGATALREMHIGAVAVPKTEEHCFYLYSPSYKATLYVPTGTKSAYEANPEFYEMFVEIIEEDPNPIIGEERVFLVESFDAEVESDHWSGNDQFKVTGQAAIVKSDVGVSLRLGATDGIGRIESKPLDLSMNEGHFRIRFDLDGWSEGSQTVYVALLDANGSPISTERRSLYLPAGGASMRTQDIPFTGGQGDCRIAFYTEDNSRTVVLDNIKVYTGGPVVPNYHVDKETIDFGRIGKGSLSEPIELAMSAEFLNEHPHIKIISEHVGAFTSEVTWLENHAAHIKLQLDGHNVSGDYKGYLSINYQDVNELLIPIKGTIIDNANPLGLDDENPLKELSENFDSLRKFPRGWKSISLQGTHAWQMNNESSNHFVEIVESETEPKGDKAHALFILPALDANVLIGYDLKFDLAIKAPHGASLHLVQVNKETGTTQPLLNLTAMQEKGWHTITYPLASHSGTLFLALEYQGDAQQWTKYQVDYFRCVLHVDNDIVLDEKAWTLEGDRLTIRGEKSWRLYDFSGGLTAHGQGSTVLTLPAHYSGILEVLGQPVAKVLVP